MISEETFTVVLPRPLAVGKRPELRSMVLMPRDDGFGGVVALREVTLVVVQVVGLIVVLVLSFLNGRKRRAAGTKGFSKASAASCTGGCSCSGDDEM